MNLKFEVNLSIDGGEVNRCFQPVDMGNLDKGYCSNSDLFALSLVMQVNHRWWKDSPSVVNLKD